MQPISIKIPRKFGPFKWVKIIAGDYPSEWNDLTRKQYVAVINLLHSSGEMYFFRVRLVSIMLGLSKLKTLLLAASFKIAKWTGTNKYANVNELKEEAEDNAAIMMVQLWWLFAWVQEDITLTKNLIRWIKPGLFGTKLYGPDDGLSTMTAEEWMWVDLFYMAWRENNDFEDLHKMVACMYRPKIASKKQYEVDFTGDIREPFNIHLIDGRVEKIKNLNEVELLAIMHWYESSRHVIVKDFDRVFTESNETDAEDYGWPAVFMAIAQDGPFGNLEKVNGENVSTVLLHMQVRAKEAEEAKKRAESLKR